MSAAAAPFPRIPLFATVAVLAGVLAVSAAARFSGFATPPAPPPVIATTELTFSDLADGGVAVHDFSSGKIISTIAARDDGFLRTTLRVLVGQREKENLGNQKPFLLQALQGGRIQLTDLATGQTVELEAFGQNQINEFLPLIHDAEAKQP
jgi:putative photosynthetic complex assembly protein